MLRLLIGVQDFGLQICDLRLKDNPEPLRRRCLQSSVTNLQSTMVNRMMPWAAITTPSLRGVNIVRTFGDGTARRAALQQVTMELYPGQIVLLMGPSGSGKSTLLAILSGLLEPDSGQVLADDDGQMRDVW